jgi:glycosyltransferase involved in cell wall biosynthesis
MLPRRRSRWRRWVKLRVALWQADRVVTGSEQVRAKVCRVFRLPPDRTGIVPYGAAAIFARPASRPAVQAAVMGRHGLTLPYLLHVGGFGPNKNLLALTEAFADVTQQPRFATVTLVFVGRREDDRDYPESQALDRLIERRDLGPRVRFVGRQDDRRLRDLYQGAEALVVASLEEGFGLPGLEATACGTPVIATIASPLPQVLGDAALPVDPRAPAALRQALEIVLGDASAQQRLRRAAAARGPALHWEQSARAALRIFEEVADGTARPRV